MRSFRKAPTTGISEPRELARLINQIMDGRLNTVADIIIADTTPFPTTISDDLVNSDSVIVLTPTNSVAAGGSYFITNIVEGAFDIDDSVAASQSGAANLRYAVMG